MWGAVSCWPLEPSLWPPLARPRPWGGSDPLPASAISWWHRPPGMPFSGPAPTSPTTWPAWGTWGPVGLDARLPQRWRLSRVWGPGPEGTAGWALTQPGLDRGGYVMSQDLPFLVRTETNTHEIFRGTVTWPWLEPQNKGSDTKMFKQLTAPLPHLPRKGLRWELSGSLGCLRHEALLSLQGPQYIFLGSTPWTSVLV